MQKQLTSFLTLLKKESLVDGRKKNTLGSVMLFILISVLLPSIALSGEEDTLPALVKVAFFWNACFFIATLICQKSFSLEADTKTLVFLRLTFSALTIFLGKSLYNAVIIFISSLIMWICFSIGLDLKIYHVSLFVTALMLFSIGVSTTLTFLSALTSELTNAVLYLLALGFPLLVGMLWILVKITNVACSRYAFFSDSAVEIELLSIFCVVMLPTSCLFFELLWKH